MLVIEQLKTIQNIYDLLALCCAYILSETKEKPCLFAEIDLNKLAEVDDMIEDY